MIGVICAPIFAYETGILWEGDTYEAWRGLGINIVGALAIAAWSTFWSLAIFGPLKYFGMLRIDRETEFKGNDMLKHGESAYPAESWVEHQYNRYPQHFQGNGGHKDRQMEY